ncbi:MAG: ATP-binding protein [Pirellulaceae bacterium]
MERLSDLEHVRRRPGMYVGDSNQRGLHHLVVELLDNVVDQYLALRATTIRVSIDGEMLEVIDDGLGLPFDQVDDVGESLATKYLTKFRFDAPTADGHTPHVHLGGWGVGLRIVSALTATCEVSSWRNGVLWRQTFSHGEPVGPAEVVAHGDRRGTTIRLTIDRSIFPTVNWEESRVETLLKKAAYLFPGFKVETPSIEFSAPSGLADWAAAHADELDDAKVHQQHALSLDHTCDDYRLQVAITGTGSRDTQWHAFANGNTSSEGGSHLEALKLALWKRNLRPSVAMIHLTLESPRFAGPTKSKLHAPELRAPICDVIMSWLDQTASLVSLPLTKRDKPNGFTP